jgi:hypothetical protein
VHLRGFKTAQDIIAVVLRKCIRLIRYPYFPVRSPGGLVTYFPVPTWQRTSRRARAAVKAERSEQRLSADEAEP